MARSTTVEFGRKTAVGQAIATLAGADYGRRIYQHDINVNQTPVILNPAGNHDRPSNLRKGMRTATVTFQEELLPAEFANNAPLFFDVLKAAGFVVATSVDGATATLGNVADNTNSLTCVSFDGIQKKTAWGVHGLVEIAAASPVERFLLTFNGKGHGDEEDDATFPTGVTEDIYPGAIFEDNTLTIGGFVPELTSLSFKTETEPALLGNGLAADGFVEAYLAGTQAFLRMQAWQHTKALRDWTAYLNNTETANQPLVWTMPISPTRILRITGSLLIIKRPNRIVDQGVGAIPLEFQFDRTAPIVISQEAAA